MASHDLREPLRTIGSFSALLAQRYRDKLDASADEYLSYVEAAVVRMNNLISDLLLYSSVENSPPGPITETASQESLDDAIRNLLGSIERSEASVTHGVLPFVPYDRPQLTQLFQNLIANSIKYRRLDAPPRIHVTAEAGEHAWTFSVRDNGMGFAQEHAEEIFTVFKRLHGREYEGTGIGLAICKRVVTRHKGRIWATSQLGVGSEFSFSVPF
jgi:light-regulated signal transduction histidine kinase (bacteriophytochrome)